MFKKPLKSKLLHSSPTSEIGQVGANQTPLIEPVRILRLPEVLTIFPVSRSSWWAGVKDGKYPSQVRLGLRSVGWRSDAIKELVCSLREVGGSNA